MTVYGGLNLTGLTKEDSQMVGFPDELVQHLIGDVLDLISVELFDQPGQHLLLVVQVTIVQGGDLWGGTRLATVTNRCIIFYFTVSSIPQFRK